MTCVSSIQISPRSRLRDPRAGAGSWTSRRPEGPTRTMNSPSSISSESIVHGDDLVANSLVTLSNTIFRHHFTPSRVATARRNARHRECRSRSALSIRPRADRVEAQQGSSHDRRDLEHAEPEPVAPPHPVPGRSAPGSPRPPRRRSPRRGRCPRRAASCGGAARQRSPSERSHRPDDRRSSERRCRQRPPPGRRSASARLHGVRGSDEVHRLRELPARVNPKCRARACEGPSPRLARPRP